jgi:hypothetical protein
MEEISAYGVIFNRLMDDFVCGLMSWRSTRGRDIGERVFAAQHFLDFAKSQPAQKLASGCESALASIILAAAFRPRAQIYAADVTNQEVGRAHSAACHPLKKREGGTRIVRWCR